MEKQQQPKKDNTVPEEEVAWLCRDCIRECKQKQASVISCPRYTRQLTLSFGPSSRKGRSSSKKKTIEKND